MTSPIEPLVDKVLNELEQVYQQAIKIQRLIDYSPDYEVKDCDQERMNLALREISEAIDKFQYLMLED